VTNRMLPVLIAAVCVLPYRAVAQSAENVAVVINETSDTSRRVGDRYITSRGIPEANVIRIRTSTDETIDRQAYVASIEQPIAAALSRSSLQDRVLYLVLTKGVPLRIAGTAGTNGTTSSVDSELTLLYRRMSGRTVPLDGRIPNPYYLGTKTVTDARQFTHVEHDIYLVSRLDAYTVEEAIAIVDRAQAPSREGVVVLDQKNALVNRLGEDWLEEAAKRLTAAGHGDRVMLEPTSAGARDIKNVIGYYSWGSNDPSNRTRKYGMEFVPGSIAATFVSSDARTFMEPPADWTPSGTWDNKSSWVGSPQSLIADLLREGATGAAGHVSEPYLQSAVRPEILFPAYFAGFNLVESFYLAIPHLSWQTLVIGDPLCAPFPRKVLTRVDIEKPVDPATELPALFSARRLSSARATLGELSTEALTAALQAEARLARRDQAGGMEALQRATTLAPGVAGLQLQLGILLDQAGQYDGALERYRRVLALQPNSVIALNNLAYGLAVRKDLPADAHPLAKRAVALAPTDPTVIDTLAWIEHLLGNDDVASKLLTEALRRGSRNAEIHFHAAVVYAARNAWAAAATQLKAALQLDPALENREDVRQLRSRIQAAGRSPEGDPSSW
jgi:uncharacterized protein (TIGR03790 family)